MSIIWAGTHCSSMGYIAEFKCVNSFPKRPVSFLRLEILPMKAFLPLIAASCAFAASFTFSYTAEASLVSTMEFRGETILFIPGGALGFETGLPALPAVSRSFVIPQGESVSHVSIEVLSTEDLGVFNLAPSYTGILSQPIPSFIPRSSVYGSGELFPETPIIGHHTGSKTGFRIGSFDLTPFVWHTSSGNLQLITSAVITVTTTPDPEVEPLTLSHRQVETALSVLESFVDNPGMLRTHAPAVADTRGPVWVVIAHENHESILEPLVAHRNETHGAAELKTLQWIYANYTGVDTQEQIRNYLIDAYENQGLIYALIVGDFGETNRVSSLSQYGHTLNSTADLYYSDLDGNWDGNGNGLFGELVDGLDYYTDIYVGRFSADIPAWITTMVNKTIAYETTAPSGDWRTTALLAGAGLWPEYNYWGSFICDTIAARIPGDWSIHKLYETYAGHPNNQIDLVNQGVSFVGPHGHGYDNGVFWYYNPPTDIFSNSNYTGLTNADMLPIFHSIACLAGKLSAPACIAERLMLHSGGGAVAVMFNSDNGWGSPPNMGASEWLELHFANQLWVYGQNEIGVTHALSKDAFYAGPGVPMKHWVLQENNLLGDPALLFASAQMGIEDDEWYHNAGPALGSPSPNPTRNTASVTLTMPSPGMVDLTLFDLSGRAVLRIASENLSQGTHAFQLNTEGLPSGYYRLAASSAAGRDTVPLVVLR